MGRWRGWWSASLYRQVVGAALAVAPVMTMALATLVVVDAALAATVAVAIGAVVGHVPAAVAAGAGSAAADDAYRSLAVVALLVAVQQLPAAAEVVVGSSLARRVEGSMRHRVMAAAMAPVGTAHLADAGTRSAIDGATTLGSGRAGPMMSIEALVPMWSSLASGLALAVLVGRYRWWLGVLLAGVWLYARAIRRWDNLAQAEMLRSNDFGTRRQGYFRQLTLTPDAAKEIRIFGLGRWLVDCFHDQWVDTVEAMWRTRRERRPNLILPVVVLLAANGLAFGVVARDLWRGATSLREVVVLLQALLGISAMAEPGGRSIPDSSFVLGARSFPLVPRLEALTGRTPAIGVGSPMPRVDDISLRSVSVSYPGQARPVLDALDLDIPSGRSLAIVGHNGAGKTTLVKTLCGLLPPDAGAITVGGTSLTTLDPASWRASTAVVFQDFVHLHLTVRENVTCAALGRPVSAAQLERIAERVGLREMVEGLPHGWETVVTGQQLGGVDLSGGQWQRVALARALCAVEMGASLLIMDEPTANLDVRAEAAFYDRFLDLTAGITTVVISHRFSTVRRADSICVLGGGAITERGTHAELLALDRDYARLFHLQAAAFATAEGPEDA